MLFFPHDIFLFQFFFPYLTLQSYFIKFIYLFLFLFLLFIYLFYLSGTYYALSHYVYASRPSLKLIMHLQIGPYNSLLVLRGCNWWLLYVIIVPLHQISLILSQLGPQLSSSTFMAIYLSCSNFVSGGVNWFVHHVLFHHLWFIDQNTIPVAFWN